MSDKVRNSSFVSASLILLATLVLGIAIGALGSTTLNGARERQIAGVRGEGGFVAEMERVMQLTDAQAAPVRALLDSIDTANRATVDQANAELRNRMTELESQLSEYLSPEQVDRFRRVMRRRPPGREGGPEGQRPPPPRVGPTDGMDRQGPPPRPRGGSGEDGVRRPPPRGSGGGGESTAPLR